MFTNMASLDLQKAHADLITGTMISNLLIFPFFCSFGHTYRYALVEEKKYLFLMKSNLLKVSFLMLMFKLGIFVAKVAVLFVVIVAGYFLTGKGCRPWNVIGLYGIFATMCNDFGIALPVCEYIQ